MILLLSYLEQVWDGGQLVSVLNCYRLIMTTRLRLSSLSHTELMLTNCTPGGVVALSVECRTRDQEVVGSSLGRARGVKTLGMFLTPMCLCSPMWVAGKTVWSPCYTRPYLSALEIRVGIIKRYRNWSVYFFYFTTYNRQTDVLEMILCQQFTLPTMLATHTHSTDITFNNKSQGKPIITELS